MERLSNLKGNALVDARLNLREAIRGLISKIDVEIKKKGWNTELSGLIHFHSWHHRRVTMEVRRGNLTLFLADSAKWDKTEPKMIGEWGGLIQLEEGEDSELLS